MGTFGPLPKPVLELFHRHKIRNPERPTPPTTDELIGVLAGEFSLCSTLFVVVDALDECKEIELLLETLCVILNHSGSNCRFLFTSRADNEIQRVLEKRGIKNLQIRSAAVDHDVAIYVRAVLETDDRLHAHRQGIKDLIATKLTNGAKGMYVSTTTYWRMILTHIGSAGFNARLIISERSEQPMMSNPLWEDFPQTLTKRTTIFFSLSSQKTKNCFIKHCSW